jgi:hypothetical protein
VSFEEFAENRQIAKGVEQIRQNQLEQELEILLQEYGLPNLLETAWSVAKRLFGANAPRKSRLKTVVPAVTQAALRGIQIDPDSTDIREEVKRRLKAFPLRQAARDERRARRKEKAARK